MSEELKIEKGLPIRGSNRERGGKWINLSRQMDVGDSVFIPGKTIDQAHSLFRRSSKSLGYKFSVRTLEGGVRVWRIA